MEGAKRLVRKFARDDIGSHAVLFYGVRGSGKTSIARALAEAWLCLSPVDGGADGTCRACLSFSRNNNADFLLIEPSGASQIIKDRQIVKPNDPKPDDPTPLRDFFRTPPLFSRHKVTLIEDAHRLNAAAANALLKTLEEPWPFAKLILTTDSVGSMVPTILSRCISVACELPDESELAQLVAPPDLVSMVNGAPGRFAAISAHPEEYRALLQFTQDLKGWKSEASLVVSDRFRAIADAFGSALAMNVRASNTFALELLAGLLARDESVPPWWSQEVIQTHRWIQGNANPQIALDALFTALLSHHR